MRILVRVVNAMLAMTRFGANTTIADWITRAYIILASLANPVVIAFACFAIF